MNQQEKIPFKTLMNLPKVKGMKVGTEYVNEYGYDMDHRNIVGLSKIGEVNQYEKIQMHADECKIELILAKAALDPTVLQQRKGVYADITEMPKTLAEFKNMEIRCINEWNRLDLETKKKFDNSFDKFISEFGSETWMKNMGIETVEEVKEVVKEVSTGDLSAETPAAEGGEGNE